MRRCIACRQSFPQDELIRFTLSDGSIVADRDRRAEGRGFYLCRNKDCVELAIKRKSFNRICRRSVSEAEIFKAVKEAAGSGQGGINVKEG